MIFQGSVADQILCEVFSKLKVSQREIISEYWAACEGIAIFCQSLALILEGVLRI